MTRKERIWADLHGGGGRIQAGISIGFTGHRAIYVATLTGDRPSLVSISAAHAREIAAHLVALADEMDSP